MSLSEWGVSVASRAWPRHIMVTPAMTVNARNTPFNEKELEEEGNRLLLQGAGVEVSIHVDATECPFYGIYFAVLIAIKLLEVIVGQIKCLRMRHAGGIRRRTWIIPLGIFKDPIMHQVGPRLDDGFRHTFL